ncbi:hypothetical protein NFI96_000781 [Prochilodus magdalenae]|nr:hypothetical protein NFI96_000781 [Prochilodus magdalenae]
MPQHTPHYTLTHTVPHSNLYLKAIPDHSVPTLVFFRWFLQVLGYHKLSKPSLVNGVAMATSFFLVRIAVIPVYYSHMYSVYGTEAFYRLPLGARSAWLLCSLCLDVMNVMWMRKILRGCLKVLRSSICQKATTEMETRKTD